MKSKQNVTWQFHNFSIEGYPHFKVTNKYKRKQNIFVTTLEVVSLLTICIFQSLKKNQLTL